MIVNVQPGEVKGEITIPASKSLTQRAYVLALLNNGTTIIKNAGSSEDEVAALSVIKDCGAEIKISGDVTEIRSEKGIHFKDEINCRESGLLMRVISFIAA